MSPRDKLITRVRKLRALAASSDQGDAQAATTQANAMIAKHGLTEAELSPPKEKPTVTRGRRPPRPKRAKPTSGDNKSEDLINTLGDILDELF